MRRKVSDPTPATRGSISAQRWLSRVRERSTKAFRRHDHGYHRRRNSESETEAEPGASVRSPALESDGQFRLGRLERGNFLVRGNVPNFRIRAWDATERRTRHPAGTSGGQSLCAPDDRAGS